MPDAPDPSQGGDPAVYTLLGEAGTNPQGQLAVGSTLYNRQQASGASSMGAVATDPSNGYEAWNDTGARARTMQQYPVGSPEYNAAAGVLTGLQSGKTKPLPYDTFYSPTAEAALGRQKPAWDDGSGSNIGGNLFFSGKYKPQNVQPDQGALDAAFGVNRGGGGGAGVTAGGADAEPDQASLDQAFGVNRNAPGTFQINWNSKTSRYEANGVPYTRDPNQSDIFYDPQGKDYRVQNVPEPPASVEGSAKALGSGLLGFGIHAADALGNPAAVGGEGFDLGARLTTLAAQNAGLITPTQQQNANTWLLGGRQQFLGPTASEQQSAMGLSYQPQNALERGLRIAGAAAPAGVLSLPSAVLGAAGAFGGEELGRYLHLPPELQQLLSIGGGAISGVAGEGGASAAMGGARAAGDVVAPFRAGLSQNAAEAQAATKLATGTADLPATRSALANTPYERVPGSQPTTGQLTGDTGILEMERGARTRSPGLFTERAADQNAARVEALQGVQQGGNAAALPTGISEAETATRAAEGKLWDAVDPDKTMTGNVTATTQAAKDIAGQVAKIDPMKGEEASIFNAASQMPAVSPVSELIALRSRVSTAMRNELISNGRSATYARLTQLRGAIQDNLSQTIGDKVAADAANQAPGAQTPFTQLQALIDDARARGESVSFGRTSQVAGGNVPVGTTGSAGPGGTGGATAGGPGADAGVPPTAGTPTFDEAAGQRLAAATNATKERARVFGNPVVQKILGVSDPADVTKTIGGILRGRTAVQDMGAIAEAASKSPGGMDGLRQAVADHISNTLIGNTEVGTSGVAGIKSDMFQTFVRNNRAALAKVFTPQELDTLDNIAADIQQANRSNTAVKLPGQSNTAQDTTALGKFFKAAGERGPGDMFGALLGAGLGRHLGIPFGEEVGGFIGGKLTDSLQVLRAKGITRVNDLVTEALLNPEVAQRLLAKVPDSIGGQRTAIQGIADAVGRGFTAGASTATRPQKSFNRSALGGLVPSRPPANALQGVF